MTAILYQAISSNNYRKCILKCTNVTRIYTGNANRNENIQRITGTCRALTQVDYTHLHNQVANIVHQEVAIKRDCQGATNALLLETARASERIECHVMVQMNQGIICTGSPVYLPCLREKRHDLPWWVNNTQAEYTKVQDTTCQITVI
jgi:hypothetical protein